MLQYQHYAYERCIMFQYLLMWILAMRESDQKRLTKW